MSDVSDPGSATVADDGWVRDGWRTHHFDGDLDRLVDGGTLVRAWTTAWAADGAAEVMWDPTLGWVSAARFEEMSRRAAGALRAGGVAPGDRVIVSCAPSVVGLAAHVGALRVGAVVAPTNTSFGARELQRILDVAAPTAAVLDDPGRLAETSAAPSLVVDPASLQAHGGGIDEFDQVGGDDTAMLLFTSGTTGDPKGVPISHRNLLAASQSVRLAWNWQPDDCLVLSLPVFHAHGLGVGVHGSLLAGGHLVVLPAFDAAGVIEQMTDHAGTMLFGVPTMWGRIVAEPTADRLRRARLLVSGSAPLSEDVFAAVAAATGQPPLERYGMSETGMLVSNPLGGERRAGTVGLPLPGVELRLRDPGEDGVGEVEVRGPNVFGGYLGAAPLGADDWFSTGDLGRLDEAGYLRLVSRSKELIISGGFNVYPSEVEAVIRTHPAVTDVAVVGAPDEKWGERVVAFVVAEGITVDELRTLLEPLLAPYKRPKQIEFIGELPRNAMGKVVRSQLQGPPN